MPSASQPNIARINYLNAAAYVVNCIVTYAVGASDSSHSNAEISAKYQTLVTPAGWAFAIWGVIFIMQFVWAVAQLLPAFRASPLVLEGVRWYYLGVCGAQVAWTLFFTNELISLSLIAMLLILALLDKIVGSQHKLGGGFSTRDWVLKAPFEIHAGWILAASLVNISVVLVKWNASALVQFTAALVSLVILLLGNAYFLHLSRPIYSIPLVLSWATVAIGQELRNPKDSILSTFTSKQISIVRMGSFTASALILVGVITQVYMTRSSHRREESGDSVPAQASDPLLSNK
jgi:hypothetical protein